MSACVTHRLTVTFDLDDATPLDDQKRSAMHGVVHHARHEGWRLRGSWSTHVSHGVPATLTVACNVTAPATAGRTFEVEPAPMEKP